MTIRLNNFESISATYSPFLLNVHFNGYERPNYPLLDLLARVPEAVCIELDNAGSTIPPEFEPLRTLYRFCSWLGNQCQCSPSETLLSLYGSPDLQNTGFCLDYLQS